jgi:DNA-binding response OmpR family regulator
MARILLAEDQEDLREMIAIALRLDGHQVVLASDGQEALQQAKETTPDLFILDIHMPMMTGYEVTQSLRKEMRFKNSPIIIISAKSLDDDLQARLDSGEIDFLRKPFPPKTLTSRVNSHLSKN